MAVVIRLQRHGGKKNPYYHIVAVDSRRARDSGSILETLGKYDPMQSKESERRVTFNTEKIQAWLSKGARPSDRIYKFLANTGLLPKKDAPVQTKKNQPSEKTLAKLKSREEKLAKANEIAATPASAEGAVTEQSAAESAPTASLEAPIVESIAESVSETSTGASPEPSAE
jgi:small subunit ribosomal protein S16